KRSIQSEEIGYLRQRICNGLLDRHRQTFGPDCLQCRTISPWPLPRAVLLLCDDPGGGAPAPVAADNMLRKQVAYGERAAPPQHNIVRLCLACARAGSDIPVACCMQMSANWRRTS